MVQGGRKESDPPFGSVDMREKEKAKEKSKTKEKKKSKMKEKEIERQKKRGKKKEMETEKDPSEHLYNIAQGSSSKHVDLFTHYTWLTYPKLGLSTAT